MGSKPKQQDYQASGAEKASASVAMAEYKNFKKKYDPLLQEMRDKSLTEDVTTGLRGRANADTMQALTSQPSYQGTQSNTSAGDMAQAYQGQLGIANTSGKDIQNKMQTNVLGTARGQAADAQTGMAQASRLGTSQALTRAKANQDVANSKLAAATKIGSAFVAQGLDNMSSGEGGSFFSPAGEDGKKISGLKNRLDYSGFFGPGST
jgi:hypothetical protein